MGSTSGIGSRFGLTAEIIRQPPYDSTARLLVIDTDSRSLAAPHAAGRVRETLGKLNARDFEVIFKKIDSVLRGPVLAEIEAAMQSLNKRLAILAPANPSRGRTIRNGQYHIDGVPLNLTPLANDPEHPREFADLRRLVGEPGPSITIADASESRDVEQLAASLGRDTLPVGAADFFAAILSHAGFVLTRMPENLEPARILMVCGTTNESSRRAIEDAAERGVGVVHLPTSESNLLEAVGTALEQDGHAIVTSGAIQSGSARNAASTNLGKAVARAIERLRIDELLIEGGATSSAILRQMGWHRFGDINELAAGVVRMSVTDRPIHITVKPGSYPWPDSVWERFRKWDA